MNIPRTSLSESIERSIRSQELPWTITVQHKGSFVRLSARVRDPQGSETTVSKIFRAPTDVVTLPGLNEALSLVTTRLNGAEHMGLTVLAA